MTGIEYWIDAVLDILPCTGLDRDPQALKQIPGHLLVCPVGQAMDKAMDTIVQNSHLQTNKYILILRTVHHRDVNMKCFLFLWL